MQTLSGFFAPTAPNFESRAEAFADGTIELLLLDQEPSETSLQGFSAQLSRDFGGTAQLVAGPSQLADCLLVLDAPEGRKQLKFILRSNQLNLQPGTYVLRLFRQGQQLLTRSLVVPPQV